MEVFSFVFVMLVICGCMWMFFKFMYPKPPKAFMPQEGDIITPRHCDYCGYPLAEYRGIVETKPSANAQKREQRIANTWFFCNGEHQAKFHAGETYHKPKP